MRKQQAKRMSGKERGKEKIFMSWKTDWDYLTGDLKVTVRAKNQYGRYRMFYFTCYASDEVEDYDRLSALAEAAYTLAKLRNYHCTEVIDIKKI